MKAQLFPALDPILIVGFLHAFMMKWCNNSMNFDADTNVSLSFTVNAVTALILHFQRAVHMRKKIGSLER